VSPETTRDIATLAYIAAAALFVLGIKGLGSVRTARRANGMAGLGMLLAIVATMAQTRILSWPWILAAMALGSAVGAAMAFRTAMTAMPQMVGLLNGFGGVASALVSWAEHAQTPTAVLAADPFHTFVIGVGVLVGGVTFSGSMVAWAKLEGRVPGRPIALPGNEAVNALLLLGCLGLSGWLVARPALGTLVVVVFALALVLGCLLVLPIGGADMPVVISLMNSYSGIAGAVTGFLLDNSCLIVSGALVGASGIILTSVMCKGMNRSLANVLWARVGSDGGGGGTGLQGTVRQMTAEDAALVLETAQQVMVVPGYGMAVAQAQHAMRDLAAHLERKGCKVLYAIHPVAGRMPGHMNILLAEASIPYELLLELDPANAEIARTDVCLILGANDVVNPAARTDTTSPIYGMPIVDVDKARSVLVVKRSLGGGYSGVDNPLFVMPNTAMVLGDAKKVLTEILAALKQG
jgi:NAD(P) transhydrogenase subunit beta